MRSSWAARRIGAGGALLFTLLVAWPGAARAGCRDTAGVWLDGTPPPTPSLMPAPCTGAAECAAACDRGLLPACARLGALLDRTLGTVPDDEVGPVAARALAAFEKACTGGLAAACVDLSLLLQAGRGVKREERRAIGLQERACRAGEARGCTLQARVAGRTGRRGRKKAASLLARGCERGDWRGCETLALSLVGCEGRVKQRKVYETARARTVTLLDAACRAGDAEACTEQARRSLHDKEGRERAVAVLEWHCGRGCGAACDRLGDLHGGLDLASGQDHRRAATYYQRACAAGHARGCGMVAHGLTDGRGGLVKDERKAQALFQRACRLGEQVFCQFRREEPAGK
jgi:uncharacterized protein